MVTEGTKWTRVVNTSRTLFMLFLNQEECPDEKSLGKSLRRHQSEPIAIKRDATSPSAIYVDEEGIPAGRKFRTELYGAHKVYTRDKDLLALCEHEFRHFPTLNSNVVRVNPATGETAPIEKEKTMANVKKTGLGKGYQMCERLVGLEILDTRFLIRYHSNFPYQARELFEKLASGDAYIVAKEGEARSDSGRTRWVYEDGTRRVPTKPPVPMKVIAEDLVLQFVEHLDDWWADMLKPMKAKPVRSGSPIASEVPVIESAGTPVVPQEVQKTPSQYFGFRRYDIPKQTSWWG